MNVEFTPHGWEDYQFWVKNDPVLTQKINTLISVIRRTPCRFHY
ncbi:type II toxin-antitoxin system YoeB family toxin [Cyclobacterium sp.]|nr:type II toxin-antitoxin system YoeB family toxin [Cyclobacterium sp.]